MGLCSRFWKRSFAAVDRSQNCEGVFTSARKISYQFILLGICKQCTVKMTDHPMYREQHGTVKKKIAVVRPIVPKMLYFVPGM